jgi:DnaK suppressor protein
MEASKLEKLQRQLLEMRSQILNRSNYRSESLKINTDDLADETDHAAAMVQQNVNLNVQERDRFLLREIEHALSKFESGEYGICEDTEEPIEFERLQVQPWTRYSVEAAELREQKSKRFATGTGGGSLG